MPLDAIIELLHKHYGISIANEKEKAFVAHCLTKNMKLAQIAMEIGKYRAKN